MNNVSLPNFVKNLFKRLRRQFIEELTMFDFRPFWKQLNELKQVQPHNYVEYSALRAIHNSKVTGRSADSLFRQYLVEAFTPITNQTKLDNGRKPLDTLNSALWTARIRALQNQFFNEFNLKEFLSEEHLNEYHRVICSVETEDFNRRYVYVFVRQDLKPEYQLVQAAHVTMELGAALGEEAVKGVYYTVCGVQDLSALHALHLNLVGKRTEVIRTFIEPDIGDEMTAIAIGPIPMRERGDLLKHKLLRFSK